MSSGACSSDQLLTPDVGKRRRLEVRLQRGDFKVAPPQRPNRLHRGARAGDGRVVGNVVRKRGATQAEAVGDRLSSLGRVEDQLYAAAAHLIDNVGPPLLYLVDDGHGEPRFAELAGGAARCDQFE